jgi:acetyl esterase/lipase
MRGSHRSTWLALLLSVAVVGACACDDRWPPASKQSANQASPARPQQQQQTLAEARQGFVTRARECEYRPDPPVPEPPEGVYEKVRYRSPAGELVAILTPDPGDGKRRPAVLWCHGGFGGIGDYYWSPQPATNDQTPRAMLDAGFVVMLPAWRGENENPGRFEMYLGEVDDAMAALDHLRALPYVDPARVYVVGHSSGGAIALLLAELAGPDKVRAVVSFGGVLDARSMRNGWEPMIPFGPSDEHEMTLRSPIDFIASLKTPTWYIEGELLAGPEMTRAAASARDAGAPLTVYAVRGGNHFDILRPLTRLLAERIAADTGPELRLDLGEQAVQAAFEAEHAERLSKRRTMPIVTLSPAAVTEIKKIIARDGLEPNGTWMQVGAGGALDLVEGFNAATHLEVRQDGVRIAVQKDAAERIRGLTIDFIDGPQGGGFSFGRRDDAGE